MSSVVQFLEQVAQQVQSGWTNIVPGGHPNSAEELHYERLKGLV
jgi:hypothetical protein